MQSASATKGKRLKAWVYAPIVSVRLPCSTGNVVNRAK